MAAAGAWAGAGGGGIRAVDRPSSSGASCGRNLSRSVSCGRRSGVVRVVASGALSSCSCSSREWWRAAGARIGKVSAAARGDSEAERRTQRRAASERSERCNEELLMFLFQLDLSTRLQRALNSEQYEAAKQLREKIAEVDQEVARQREGKMGSISSKDEAQDKALTVLRLKAELQRAIETEDYPGAARIRDSISKVEADSLAASAKALVSQNLKYTFRLGQRVKHKIHGYQGVIGGMDPQCCESEDWVEAAGINQLSGGKNQPFYHVLVRIQEDPSEPPFLVAYVAEENLIIPDEQDIGRFDHPYTYFLFYGMDGAGDFIPSKQLREKYNAPRHELPYEEDDGSSSSEGPS